MLRSEIVTLVRRHLGFVLAHARVQLLSSCLVIISAVGCRHTPDSARAESQPADIQSFLHLETFVLNLADPESRAYLRIGIDLGLDHPLAKKGNDASGPPVAIVRDAILGVLAENRPEDLMTAEGKAKLKERLLRAVQARAPGLGVREVYFTEFLIQK